MRAGGLITETRREYRLQVALANATSHVAYAGRDMIIERQPAWRAHWVAAG
jgi:hypothetical protein